MQVPLTVRRCVRLAFDAHKNFHQMLWTFLEEVVIIRSQRGTPAARGLEKLAGSKRKETETMEEKDLLEMPIEIINPGNGLPEAPPCVPFISVLPCRIDFDGGGGGSVPCFPIFNPFPNYPGYPKFL